MKRCVIVSLLVAGCSDGGGNGTPEGGFVRVEHRVGESGAEATYARAEFGDVTRELPSRGRCAVPNAPANTKWLDVGDTVTLARAGAAPIVLPRATLGSQVVYGADGLPASASPAGGRFDIALAGTPLLAARTWGEAIEVPAPVVPNDFVNEIGFSVEQEITWTPSGDADEVLVEIASGHVDLVCRAKASAGRVVVSSERNSELASNGTVTFRAVRRTHETLDGRQVTLEGQSSVVVPY